MSIAAEDSGNEQRWARAGIAFAALAVLSLGLFFPTWQSMANTWWHTTAFNHGLLVLPIAGFLIWQRRRPLGRMAPVQDLLGLGLVGCFGFVWLLGHAGQVALVEQVGVIGLLIGLVVALRYWIGGESTSRSWHAKALQVRGRLLGRATPEAIIAVSSRHQGPQRARSRQSDRSCKTARPPPSYVASLAPAD